MPLVLHRLDRRVAPPHLLHNTVAQRRARARQLRVALANAVRVRDKPRLGAVLVNIREQIPSGVRVVLVESDTVVVPRRQTLILPLEFGDVPAVDALGVKGASGTANVIAAGVTGPGGGEGISF